MAPKGPLLSLWQINTSRNLWSLHGEKQKHWLSKGLRPHFSYKLLAPADKALYRCSHLSKDNSGKILIRDLLKWKILSPCSSSGQIHSIFLHQKLVLPGAHWLLPVHYKLTLPHHLQTVQWLLIFYLYRFSLFSTICLVSRNQCPKMHMIQF